MGDFADEIEACIPALRRFARALTRDRDHADDLVQDCIERALRKRRLWRPSGRLRSWLMKILLNIHRNEIRSARRQAHLVPIEDLPVEPAEPAGQTGRIALAETARALARLPAEQREILLLVVLEGMSYAETARIVGIPEGTVMSRLSRARSNLRRLTGEATAPPLRSVT